MNIIEIKFFIEIIHKLINEILYILYLKTFSTANNNQMYGFLCDHHMTNWIRYFVYKSE